MNYLKNCIKCGATVKMTGKLFCSLSCSTSYNNRIMWEHRSRHISQNQKDKIRTTRLLTESRKPKILKRLLKTELTAEEKRRRKSDAAKKGHINRPPHSEETREKLRQINKEWWRNKEWAIEKQRQLRLAQHISPNKLETFLLNLLNQWFPGEWRFTGDGKLNIDGKNPDFHDGHQHLIEFFGEYWHQGENPQDRINFFEKFGYSCMVIWEHELEQRDILKERVISWYSAGKGFELARDGVGATPGETTPSTLARAGHTVQALGSGTSSWASSSSLSLGNFPLHRRPVDKCVKTPAVGGRVCLPEAGTQW